MPVSAKPLALAGAALSLLAAAGGCESSSKSGDDDAGDPGMVLSGGTGGTGGAESAGGAGGTKTAGRGGGGAAGRGGHGGGAGRSATASGGSSGARASGGTGDVPESGAGEGGMEPVGVAGAGVAGRATAATGGSAGARPAGDGALGSSCASEEDCASGLTCVTPTSELLGGKSPAGGLCTAPCQGDSECRELAAGAYCVAFDADATITYCLEGCRAGLAGEPKCHGRIDVACTLIGLVPTSTPCTASDECSATQLCATSEEPPVCGDIVTGCVPNCGGDFDCAPGNFCDFSSGMCAPVKPTGRAIGALCNPDATTNSCNGFCQAKDEAGTEGVCAAFCTLSPGLVGCGWDGSAPGTAACLYATRLSADPGIGDVGICGALCDCNTDCVATGDRCVDESNGDIMSLWGRAGYCRPLETGESEANTFQQCP